MNDNAKREPLTAASATNDIYQEAFLRASWMLETNAPPHDILASLTVAAETAVGRGAVSSILCLDQQGLLRNGASPRLPADYLKAIDGLKPDANVGTCAAAAATGVMVITPDFCADGKWAELRHLPQSMGFVGAWSLPIKSPEGRVLGTFGTYYRERREPSAEEVSGIELLAAVAAKALALVVCA